MTARSIAIVAALAVTPLAGQTPPAAVRALDLYADGAHDEAVALFGRVLDAGRVGGELNRHARRWIEAAPPSDQPRRRLTAATLALDLAQRTMADWSGARELLEWGCELVRSSPAGDPRERTWQLAALSLIQAVQDQENSGWYHDRQQHFLHVRPRLPDEPRFELSEVVLVERRNDWADELDKLRLVPFVDAVSEVQRYWRELPETPHARAGYQMPANWRFDRESLRAIDEEARRQRRSPPLAVEHSRGLWNILDRLDPLRTHEDIRAEVLVRSAYVWIRLARPDRADLLLLEAKASRPDPEVLYLAELFTAQIRRQADRDDDAEPALRRALEAVPGGQSAGLSLAALLFERGRSREAAEVVTAVVTASPPRDPWREYLELEYRFWTPRIAELRQALR